ncbi:MAG TPA: hypothetical protein VGM88_28065 [Kofleriaceae bacterium]|jgi:hypothetical protein
MTTDLFTLLGRDHHDLQKELDALLAPGSPVVQLRASLDGVRLGLTAHAEAEEIVLGRYERHPIVGPAVASTRGAHLAQEAALAGLVGASPGTVQWHDRAYALRELVRFHHAQEARLLQPILRAELAPAEYAELAGRFATERLRQLSLLQPSTPVSYARMA